MGNCLPIPRCCGLNRSINERNSSGSRYSECSDNDEQFRFNESGCKTSVNFGSLNIDLK